LLGEFSCIYEFFMKDFCLKYDFIVLIMFNEEVFNSTKRKFFKIFFIMPSKIFKIHELY